MSPPSPTHATLLVALGGGAGAAARYQLGRALTRWLGADAVTQFPWATLAVNAIGSLAMGVLAGWLAHRSGGGSGDQARLLLGVGLLGGFTTFSAFSLELVLLAQRGQIGLAALYALLSIALGISGLFFGLTLMRIAA